PSLCFFAYFFFSRSCPPPHLHSFPTRRSSDLLILQLEVTLRTFCLRPGFHFRLASRTLLGLRWMYLFLLRHTGSRICQDVLALLFLLRNFRALLTGL